MARQEQRAALEAALDGADDRRLCRRLNAAPVDEGALGTGGEAGEEGREERGKEEGRERRRGREGEAGRGEGEAGRELKRQ